MVGEESCTFITYHFMYYLDLKCSVERNLSRFTLLTSCYIEAKTAVDSKVQK